MKSVIAYTDGSVGNGKGGWASVLMAEDENCYYFGSEELVTNSRMEVYAVLSALDFYIDPVKMHIFSDSAYVVNTINKGWYKNWIADEKRKSFRKHLDLWKLIDEALQYHTVTITHVKGHANDPINNLVDKIAVFARKYEVSEVVSYLPEHADIIGAWEVVSASLS